jgi:LuxR family maltose regulon positive regulatory protein
VPRLHLIEQLNRGLHQKLTLVSAPAGFGKTTLLSEWARCVKRPVAWLSLDAGDDDVGPFWRYATAALRTVEGRIGEAAQAVLRGTPSQRLAPNVLVTALINDITSLSTSFVLVLDDYHTISELAVHEGTAFLLEHQPPQMHLVIATREDPPLPLSRLRARGQMTELRASDLRFTQAEAARFLNQTMKLDLSPEEVTALETKTEGWITGLQLVALSLQEQTERSEFIQRFAGDDRHVMDYLVDEVLTRQPKAVQHFMLQTSILERLSGPLCDAVVYGDASASTSQSILEQLEQIATTTCLPTCCATGWGRRSAELCPNFTAGRASGTRGMATGTTRSHTRWRPAILNARRTWSSVVQGPCCMGARPRCC